MRVCPLRRCAWWLARNTGTAILPVAISGTHAVLPPGSTRMSYDCPVRVVFGRPLSVTDRSAEEMMDEYNSFCRER